MKKLNALFLLILLSTLSYGQNWQNVSNSLQRKIVGADTLYRFNMGAPGFWNISDAINAATASGVTSFNGRTGAITSLVGDYSAFFPVLTGSYINPSWITSLTWSKITSTPTTLSGYGITDAAPSSGGSGYIQNQTASPQSAAFYIEGQSRFKNSGNTTSLTVDNGGSQEGIIINNTAGGIGQYIENDDGIGLYLYNTNGANESLYIDNRSSADGITVDNSTINGTGNAFIHYKNGATVSKIDHLGNITGNSFIKTGGLSTQFLKADGSATTLTEADIPFLPISKVTDLQDSLDTRIKGSGTINTYPIFSASKTLSDGILKESSGSLMVGTSNWPTSTSSKTTGRHIIGGNEGIGSQNGLIIWNESAIDSTNQSFLWLSAKSALGANHQSGGELFGGTENETDGKGYFGIRTTNSAGGSTNRLFINGVGSLKYGTMNWPTASVSESSNRVIFGGAGTPVIGGWSESAPAANNESALLLGAKNNTGSTTFSGLKLYGGLYNGSTQAGYARLSTTTSAGGEVAAVTVDSLQKVQFNTYTADGILSTSGGNGTIGVTATTGSGNVVLATSPTLITPILGDATATSLALGNWTETTVSNHKDFNYSGVQKYRMRNDGIFQTQAGFEAYKDGSNTVTVGAFKALWNAAGTTGWINQLNASNGLDWWYYTGGSGSVKLSMDISGNVTTITQSAGDNSTKVATTAYVDAAVPANITSGTYTPTTYSISNISSVSVVTHFYERNGNIATVTGRLSITPTAFASTASEIDIELPASIPSNFTLVDNAFGIISDPGSSFGYTGAVLNADTTNDRFNLAFNATSSTVTITYTIKYLVQ